MTIWQVLIAVLTSQAIVEIIKLILDRKDGKDNIKGRLITLEKDVLRTQMLLMIKMFPKEKKEIMTLSEHYFEDLEGNWYMTDIFNNWLEA